MTYHALDQSGREYMREPRTIGELPVDQANQATVAATAKIAEMLGLPSLRKIAYGTPVYDAFDMRPADARNHAMKDVLTLRGCDVPLMYT